MRSTAFVARADNRPSHAHQLPARPACIRAYVHAPLASLSGPNCPIRTHDRLLLICFQMQLLFTEPHVNKFFFSNAVSPSQSTVFLDRDILIGVGRDMACGVTR